MDTEKLIASRLNLAPRYPADSHQALDDKNCIIVAVQPTHSVLISNIGQRRVSIAIRDSGFIDDYVMGKADVVLEPSFIPFTAAEKTRLFLRETVLFKIETLPSRADPEVIRIAKDKYVENLPKEKVTQLSKPVTTILAGDLSYFNEDPGQTISEIAKINDLRGNPTILITSSSTDPDHAIALRKALRSTLESSQLWHQHLGSSGFYLAALGLAAQHERGEILVTEDSRSMMSYAAATKANMRLVRTTVTTPDLLGKEARISRNMGACLERRGIPVNAEDIDVRKKYPREPGVNAAIDGIAKIIRTKAAHLAR